MARTKVDRNPFLDPAAPSLATVLAALETAEPNPRRRGEMASGIRTVCTVLGYSPHELPADTALLGRLIRKAMPAAAGVSPSRWANARSLLLAALKRSGLAIMPGRRLHPLAPAWAALAATLPGRRAMLSRLMRWASAEGIDPEHLDQAAMDRFGTALMQDSFHQNPRDCWRRTVVAWNAAVEGVSGWPQQRLTPPPGRERYVLALEAFPAAFQADAQAWLDRLAGKAGLDAGPIKPLRPATIDKWRFALRQLGSALVASGRDIATITRLEDLVTLEAADDHPALLSRARRQPALRPDRRARQPPQGDRAASCRRAGSGPRPAAAHGCPGHAAGPGHDRQEPRGASAVPERRGAEEAGPAPGNLVRSAAGQRSGGQAACDPPAAGACRRDPAGGADAAGQPLPARARPSPPGAAPWPAVALADRHPRRRGQERRADRAAPAGAQRPPARALPGPRPPCARPHRDVTSCFPGATAPRPR